MALIPLKQIVNVYHEVGRDDWGNITHEAPTVMKCRVDESTELVKNQAGDEVVSTLNVIFNRYPNIGYDDYIEYTDEHGTVIKRKPLRIEPIRLINGKVTLTVVYL